MNYLKAALEGITFVLVMVALVMLMMIVGI
jgi:hypothetical protein